MMGFFLTDSCAAEPASGIPLYPRKRIPALTGATVGRRFYSPSQSRWLNRDPIGESGAHVLAPAAPQSSEIAADLEGAEGQQNAYSFLGNAATMDTDYLGLCGGRPPKVDPWTPYKYTLVSAKVLHEECWCIVRARGISTQTVRKQVEYHADEYILVEDPPGTFTMKKTGRKEKRTRRKWVVISINKRTDDQRDDLDLHNIPTNQWDSKCQTFGEDFIKRLNGAK